MEPVLTVMTWLIKSLLIYIILCMYCEKFYMALANCQDSCALISKARSSGTIYYCSINFEVIEIQLRDILQPPKFHNFILLTAYKS